jgi:hypothetical protein
MYVNTAARVGAGYNAGLKVDELEWIAAPVADDRQRNECALLDRVAEISGTAGLDRLA